MEKLSKVRANFQKLPTFAKEEFGPWTVWLGLVFPFISGVAVAWITPTALVFVLPIYYLAMGLIALLSRYTKLEERQKPKVEILWGDEHPYIHYGEFLNVGEIERLWRVGVKNLSTVNTIFDIEVRLVDMEPKVNVVIPAPLHRMGDNPLKADIPYGISTDIHPTDVKHMDVIGQLKTNQLFIYYADKALPQMLPVRMGVGQYRLTVRVVGRDIAVRERQFKTYLDKDGKLFMEPEGESYENTEAT